MYQINNRAYMLNLQWPNQLAQADGTSRRALTARKSSYFREMDYRLPREWLHGTGLRRRSLSGTVRAQTSI